MPFKFYRRWGVERIIAGEITPPHDLARNIVELNLFSIFKVRGGSMGYIDFSQEDQFMYICNTFVDERHRRQRLGTLLVKAVELVGKKRNLRSVWDYISPLNSEVTLPFWNRLGYRVIDRNLRHDIVTKDLI
ncbi:MAG: GNAT family N-acetyltransferase [bacterium]|nr:GNAT family N-acetyltransferase [bacterium]